MTKDTIYETLRELTSEGYTFTIVTNLLYQKSEGQSTEIYPSDIARNGIAQFITALDFGEDSLAIYYSTQQTDDRSRPRAASPIRDHLTILGYESIVAIKSGYTTTTRSIDITE